MQRVRRDWAINQQVHNRGKDSSSQLGHWPLSLDLRWGFRKWEWSRRKEGSRRRAGLCEAAASAQNSPPPLRTASWPHWDSIPGCLWPWRTSLELQKWFYSWYWDRHLLFFDKSFFPITKRKGEKSTYPPWFSPQLFSSHLCVPKKLIFVFQNPLPQNKNHYQHSKQFLKGNFFTNSFWWL